MYRNVKRIAVLQRHLRRQQRLFFSKNIAPATSTTRNSSKNSLRKWAVGLAVVTPLAAIIQGAMMLQDFRLHHGNAPMPVSPSRGLVVVKSRRKNATADKTSFELASTTVALNSDVDDDNLTYEQRPLRLLVIGDSLAAGVGVSGQGTPILPEAIAKALSSATGGRAVRWTCVGTPGASAAQIVQDILDINQERSNSLLETKLVEWQTTKRRAREWLEQRRNQQQLQEGKKDGDNESNKENTNDSSKNLPGAIAANRIQRWWLRVRRDVKSFRQQVLQNAHAKKEVEIILKERRMSKVEYQEQYDVAVVLTGLNDLKDMCLPFMTSGANSSTLSDEAREHASNEGLKGELMRVMNALKDKMRRPSPTIQSHNNDSDEKNEPNKERRVGPLVVFPALPMSPLPICQQAPLSWFIVPLLQMIDNHKKRLAESFPNSVLFVESPSAAQVRDIEADRGAIFESRNAEQVLLIMTDVTQRAKEKVESLMKEHYQRWTNDAGYDDKSRRNSHVDNPDAPGGPRDVYHQGCHDHHVPTASSSEDSNSHQPPGSTLVAADNVHPNDEGYDFWGRHIGAAIVAEWEKTAAMNGKS